MTDSPESIAVETAVNRVAIAAFNESLGVGDFLTMEGDALEAFRCRNGIPQADMNAAWQYLQDREIARMERESERAFAQLFSGTARQ